MIKDFASLLSSFKDSERAHGELIEQKDAVIAKLVTKNGKIRRMLANNLQTLQFTNEVKALKDRIQILEVGIKSMNDSGTFVNSESRDSILTLLRSPIKTNASVNVEMLEGSTNQQKKNFANQTDSLVELEDTMDETLTNEAISSKNIRNSHIEIKKPAKSTTSWPYLFKVKKSI